MSKVFIGMPVYNGSRFIRKAIESLISQTYTDWKIFISDDCSTDDTGAICREFAARDSRITYYRQEKNIGLFHNFKFTADKADSEYFMWAAQDDIRENDYLKICIDKMESDIHLGYATTCVATIDSGDSVVTEQKEITKLSGNPSILQVTKYILQPEILGKCNLMYGVFRIDAFKATWDAYPQRNVWGQDYMFSLALISRYKVYIDSRIQFKKRFGGFSDSTTNHEQKNIIIDPKNKIFPFLWFRRYLRGHMEALKGTPYRVVGFLALASRLPRAFLIYLSERNYKKILRLS